jgi:hypothetical protein
MVYYTQMMNELDNVKEEMAFKLFGRSRTLAIAGNGCVKCGEVARGLFAAVDFRDECSRKEYGISGLCQTCQDGIFGVEEGE